MSYIEHGPRAFLAGRPNENIPLVYGDYVVPKKRSEGRLKVYDSCCDIRVWSPNPLENSRYFRELTEHATLPKKIVPFDVVIDNIIEISSQAQNELECVRRELGKYKLLKLTPEQEDQLRKAQDEEEAECSSKSEAKAKLTNAAFRDTLAALSERKIRESKLVQTVPLIPIECTDSFTQLEATWNKIDIETQTDIIKEEQEFSPVTLASIPSCLSTICTCSDEYSDDETEKEEEDSDTKKDLSDTESISSREYKEIIIEKDSGIIALKNDLMAKEAELDELRELTKKLETILKQKDDNLKMLHATLQETREKFREDDIQRVQEVEQLKTNLYGWKCSAERLKEQLKSQRQIFHLKLQDVDNLRLQDRAKLNGRIEDLLKKVRDMDDLLKQADARILALNSLKDVAQQRDQLQKQYREQNCTLADQQDEIELLIKINKQMYVENESCKTKMNRLIEELRQEIERKDTKISECEEQLVSMERKISEFALKWKNTLNNWDEFKVAYEDIHNSTDYDHSISVEAEDALHDLNLLMAGIKAHVDAERRNLLDQIEGLKRLNEESERRRYSSDRVQDSTSSSERNVSNEENELEQKTIIDATSLKQKLYELHNQYIKEYDRYGTSVRDVTQLCDLDSNSEDAMNLMQQQDEISQIEKLLMHDQKVDQVLAIHMKHSIGKIHKISRVLQGAGDYHMEIVRRVERQQLELQEKDMEIDRLKKEVESRKQIGDGDWINKEEMQQIILEPKLTHDLGCDTSELRELTSHNVKCDTFELQKMTLDERMSKLVEKNTDTTEKFTVSVKLQEDNEKLHEKILNLNNERAKVLIRFEELNEIINNREEEIASLKSRLNSLQTENEDLRNKLRTTHVTIMKNKEEISNLKDKIEKKEDAIMCKDAEHKMSLQEKLVEVNKLKRENIELHKKLKQRDSLLVEKENKISCLNKKSDEVDVIDSLQKSVLKLERDKERLERNVSDLKEELEDHDFNNDKLQKRLDNCLRENEHLNGKIKQMKEQYAEMSDFCLKKTPEREPLKDKLINLSNKIYERISSLNKHGMEVTHVSKIPPESQQKYYLDEASQYERMMESAIDINSISDLLYCTNEQDIVNKLKHFENEIKQKQSRSEKILRDMENKDAEIKNLRERVDSLLSEKKDLTSKLELQMEEYQNKLNVLKKKYNSEVNALRVRHCESVERLQSTYDDILKGENGPFDSESWLNSLTEKELLKLHEKICPSNTCINPTNEPITILSRDNQQSNESICINNRSYRSLTDLEDELLEKSKDRSGEHRSTEPRSHSARAQDKLFRRKSADKIEEESATKDTCKSRKAEPMKNIYESAKVDIIPKDIFYRPNFDYKTSAKNYEQKLTTRSTENDSLEWRRKNFIHQCGVYYRLNSTL